MFWIFFSRKQIITTEWEETMKIQGTQFFKKTQNTNQRTQWYRYREETLKYDRRKLQYQTSTWHWVTVRWNGIFSLISNKQFDYIYVEMVKKDVHVWCFSKLSLTALSMQLFCLKKKKLNRNPCQLTVRHRTAADDYVRNKLVKNMYMQGHRAAEEIFSHRRFKRKRRMRAG